MTQIVYASGRNQLPSPGVIVQSGGSVPAGSYYFWLQAKNRVGYNSPSNPTLINVSSPSQLRIYIPGISYIAESEDWREFIVYASNNPNFSSSVPIGLFELYNADGVTTKPLAPNTFNASTPAQFVLNAPFLYNTEVEDYSNLDATAFFGKRHFVRSLSQVYEKRASWVPVRSNKIVEDVANANTEVVFVDEDNFNITVVDYLEQRDSWVGFYVVPRNNRPIEANTRLTFQLFVDNENYTLRVPDAIEFSVQGVINLSTFGINTNGITLPGTFRKYDPFVRNLFVERTINPGSALYVRIRLNLQASDFISRDLNKSRLKVLPVYNAEYFANYFDGNLFVGNMVFSTEERLLLEPRGPNTVYVGSGSGSVNGTTFRNRPSQIITGFPPNTNQIPVYMNLIGDVYLENRQTFNQVQRAVVSTLSGYSLPAPFTAQRTLPDNWVVQLELSHRPDKISDAASDVFLRDREGIVGGSTTNKIVVIMQHSLLGLRAAEFVINPTATKTILSVGGDSNWQPYSINLLNQATRNLFKAGNVDVLSEGTGTAIPGGVVRFSYAYYYDGTVISDINHSPLLGNIITQNLAFDSLSISYEYFGNPVNRINDLRSITRDNRKRLQIRVVSEGNAAYIYDTENTLPDNGSTIIRPSDLTINQPGRWRRLNSTEWFTGAGVPNSGLGSVLDFYIDTNSYRLWQKTSLVEWQFMANLRQIFTIQDREPTSGDNNNSIYSVNDLWFSTSSRRLYRFNGTAWSGSPTNQLNKLGDRIVVQNSDPFGPGMLLPKGDLWLNYSTGTLFRQENENRTTPTWVPIGTFRVEGVRWLIGTSSKYQDLIGAFPNPGPRAPEYPIGNLDPNTEVFNGSFGIDGPGPFDPLPLDETEITPLPNDMGISYNTGAIYKRTINNTWEFVANPRGTRVYYGNVDPRLDEKYGCIDLFVKYTNPRTALEEKKFVYGAFCFGDIFHNLNTGDLFVHTGAYKLITDTTPGNNSWVLVGNTRYIGTRFFIDTGVPSSTLGNINDLYWDASTQKIYLKQVTGWNVVTTIRPKDLTAETVLPSSGKIVGDININPNSGVVSVVNTVNPTTGAVTWIDKGSLRVNGSIFYHGQGHPALQSPTHPSKDALTGDHYFDTETGNLYKYDYPNLYNFVDANNQTISTPWLSIFTYNAAQFYVGFGEPTVSSYLTNLGESYYVDIFIDEPISLSLMSRLSIRSFLLLKSVSSVTWKQQTPIPIDSFNNPLNLSGGYFPVNIVIAGQINKSENGFYVIRNNSDFDRPLNELRQYESPNDPIGLTEAIFIGPPISGVGSISYYEFRFTEAGIPVVGETPLEVRIAPQERYQRVLPKSFQNSKYITNLRNIIDPTVPYKTANDSYANAIYFDMNTGNIYKALFFEATANAPAGFYWQIQGSFNKSGTKIHFFTYIENDYLEITDLQGNKIPPMTFFNNIAVGDLLYDYRNNQLIVRFANTNETNPVPLLNELIGGASSPKNFRYLVKFRPPLAGSIMDFGLSNLKEEILPPPASPLLYFDVPNPPGNLELGVGSIIRQTLTTNANNRTIIYQVTQINNRRAYVNIVSDTYSLPMIGSSSSYPINTIYDENSLTNPSPNLIFDSNTGLIIAPVRGPANGVTAAGTPNYTYSNNYIGHFRGSRIFLGNMVPSASQEFTQYLSNLIRDYYSEPSLTDGVKKGDYYFCTQDESLYVFNVNNIFVQKIATLSGTIWRSGEGIPTLQTPGRDGDFYIDSLEGKLYEKIQGIYRYTANLQIKGNTKFFVNGIPQNSLGDDGDIAIENISKFAYIKQNGGWVFKTSLRGTFFRVGTFIPSSKNNANIPSNVYPNAYENDLYFCLPIRQIYKARIDSISGNLVWDVETQLSLYQSIHTVDSLSRINLSSGNGNFGLSVGSFGGFDGFHLMPGDLVLDFNAKKLYRVNNSFNQFVEIEIGSSSSNSSSNFLGVYTNVNDLPSSAINGNYAFVISSNSFNYYVFNNTWELITSFTGSSSGGGFIVANSFNSLPTNSPTGTKAIVKESNGLLLNIYEKTNTGWVSILFFDSSTVGSKDVSRTLITGLSTDFFGNPIGYDARLGDKSKIAGFNSNKKQNVLTTNLNSDNQITISPNGKLAVVSSFKNVSYVNILNPFNCDQVLFWFDGTNKGDFEFRSIFQREFIKSAFCDRIAEPGSTSLLNFSSSNIAIKDSMIGSFVLDETTIPMKPTFLEQNCTLLRINLNLYVGNLTANSLIISFNDLGLTLKKVSSSNYELTNNINTVSLSLDNGYVELFFDINPATNQIVQYPSISVNSLNLNEYDNYPTSTSTCTVGAKVIVQHISVMANPKDTSLNPIELFDNYQIHSYHPLKEASTYFVQLDLNRDSPSYIQVYGFDINSEKFDNLNQAVFSVRSTTNNNLLLPTSNFEYISPTKCVVYLAEGGISIRNQNWIWHSISTIQTSFFVAFAFKLVYYLDNSVTGTVNHSDTLNLVEFIYEDVDNANTNLYTFRVIDIPVSMIGSSLRYFVGYYDKNNSTFSYSFNPFDLSSYQTINLFNNLHKIRLFNSSTHYQIRDGVGVNTGLSGVYVVKEFQDSPIAFTECCSYDIHLYESLFTESQTVSMKDLYKYLKSKWGNNTRTKDWLT